jgi:hypothetical protein
MAVINQSPSGQASIAISGISFASLVVGSGDPFREPAVRVQDGGPSVAISFGVSTVIQAPLTAGAVALLDIPGDNAVSTVAISSVQISATRTDQLVAVSDPMPGLLVVAEQPGSSVVVVAASTD